MKNIIRIQFVRDAKRFFYCDMEKEVDFIPFTNLIINAHGINDTVFDCVYKDNKYIARMSTLIQPTDPEKQFAHLISLGWKEIKK